MEGIIRVDSVMESHELEAVLRQSESEMLDFKRIYHFEGGTPEQKGELLKDILAIANAWRTGDGFIVIGVDEKEGRATEIVGLESPLPDHSLQQFVSSKTNRRLEFRVETVEHAGKQLSIIRIAHRQPRPMCAKIKFGDVKANVAYVRSGSGTKEATPDEIADMVRVDDAVGIARLVPTLSLEWASLERKRLGAHTELISKMLVRSQRVSPSVKQQKGDGGLLARLARSVPSATTRGATNIAQTLFPEFGQTIAGFVSVEPIDLFKPSQEEWDKYWQDDAAFHPLTIWLQNTGTVNLAHPRMEVRIPHREGLRVLEWPERPREPEHGILSLERELTPIGLVYPEVRLEQGVWMVRMEFDVIQPKLEVWCERAFYIATDHKIDVTCDVRIFADNLADPITKSLSLALDAKVEYFDTHDQRGSHET